MDARELLRSQFRFAHQFLEMALDDVSPETAATRVGGATINSIAHIYAHAVTSEDAFVSGAKGDDGISVLEAGGWGTKTGIPVAKPRQDEEWAKLNIDFAATREYAKQVYEATDEFLATAPEDVLFREADGPAGKVRIFPEIMLTHTAQHWGEIAALKGVQGMKGLPF
ncbi:MAG: DinB family protein [Dehalococcoidia bacterium]|nr:DinB family protein [Dehalococcoidia bacterium]